MITWTSTEPADSAGAMAAICVAEMTLKFVAAAPPNVTAATALKPVPVMTTLVPPPSGPAVGLIDETTGGAMYVYLSLGDVPEVPPPVVTVMSTVARPGPGRWR